MHINGLRRRIAVGLSVLLSAGAVFAAAPAANAAQVGTLSFDPGSGNNLTPTVLLMSGPCPGGTHLLVRLYGPGFPAAGFNVVANSGQATYPSIASGGRRVALSNHFQAFADAQSPPATLGGQYRLELTCRNSLAPGGPSNTGFGEFNGTLTFSSPTAWASDAPPDNSTTTSLSAAPPSPRVVGTSVTFSAAVIAADGSLDAGKVQFKNGAADMGAPVTVVGGNASFTTTTLPVGTHSITATFAADTGPSQPSTSSAVAYTIAPPATDTTTTLTAAPPGPRPQGTSVTFTAAVSGGAAGTVQFKNGAGNLLAPVSVASGSASLTTSSLPAGTNSITAEFTPADATAFNPSTSSSPLSYEITATPAVDTTTTLTATPAATADVGTPVTFTATVTGAGAAGTVQFKDGATNLGAPVTLASGSASLTTSALTVGTHPITAAFTPTSAAAFDPSVSSVLDYVITQPPAVVTTTALSVSPDAAAILGTPVTLTATVTGAGATGTVQFRYGTTDLGSVVTLTGGVAVLTTSALTTGVHSLTAVFVPTNSLNFTGSTSTAVSYTIANPITTATVLSVSPAGGSFEGSAVILTVNVSPAANGNVQFKFGSASLGSAPLNAGVATLTSRALTVGTHSLTAVFTPGLPDSSLTHTRSTSTAVSYVVGPAPVATTTTLVASPSSPRVAGTAVTFTATVTGAGAAGTVRLDEGAAILGSPVALAAGTAEFTTTALTPGTHAIKAVFTPTNAAEFVGSTSSAVSYVITAAPAAPVESRVPALPANTTKPVVVGAARVGTDVRCLRDAWSGTPTLTRQWLRGGQPIARATGGTYRIVAADLGRLLSCRVTGTNAAGAATTTSAARRVTAGTFGSVGLPVVVGRVEAGQKLLAVPGSWGDSAAVALRYQWRRNGAVVRGATAAQYLVKVGDVGRQMTVTVTVMRPGYTPAAVTSVVVLSGLPTIVGPARAGQTLSIRHGAWSPAATVSGYQWLRNGKAIARATGATYRVTAADRGAKLTVLITVKRGRVVVATVTTAAVAVAKR